MPIRFIRQQMLEFDTYEDFARFVRGRLPDSSPESGELDVRTAQQAIAWVNRNGGKAAPFAFLEPAGPQEEVLVKSEGSRALLCKPLAREFKRVPRTGLEVLAKTAAVWPVTDARVAEEIRLGPAPTGIATRHDRIVKFRDQRVRVSLLPAPDPRLIVRLGRSGLFISIYQWG